MRPAQEGGLASPRAVARTLAVAAVAAAAALAALVAPLAVRAQQVVPVAAAADTAGPLTAARGVVDAIGHRDTVAARTLLLRGARIVALGPDGVARGSSDADLVAVLAAPGPAYLERMWSPTVLARGAVATVLAPFDFQVGGHFSYCGVEAFTTVRTPAGWRVSAVTYTVEPAGCVPGPLGPPPR